MTTTTTTLNPSSIVTRDDENTGVTEATLLKLRRFNLIAGVLHLVSATVMLLLANDFELQVSTLTLNGPPGTPLAEGTVSEVWSFPLALATSAFLYLVRAVPLHRGRRRVGRSIATSSSTVATGSGGSSTRCRRP